MSNGGQIYEHAIKRVVVGLIPLKLHPKCFWKKENLVKIKKNNHNDIFQVIYVFRMIYKAWGGTTSQEANGDVLLDGVAFS